MIETEINQAIEEALSGGDRWVLVKRGLYYRPNAKGYTNHLSEAWIVTEAEADKHTYPHDEPVTKHRVPPRNFYHDLNACAEMETCVPRSQWSEWAMTIRRIVQRDCNREECYLSCCECSQLIADFWFYHATAPQRCEAFLKTIGRWKE